MFGAQTFPVKALAELAKAVGTDRRTVGRLLTELGRSGAVRRTEDGLQVARWRVAQAPSLGLWRAVLGDWFAQDRALRAPIECAGRSTEGIEALVAADEVWLADGLPAVLAQLNQLGVPGAGHEVLDAVVRAYGTARDKVA